MRVAHLLQLKNLHGHSMKVSFKVAVPLCVPTSSEWEVLLLHILTRIWCCQRSGFGPLQKVCGDFTFVLICISLVTGDAEYCFICLFDICISSLVMYLLRSLVSPSCFLTFEFKEFSVYFEWPPHYQMCYSKYFLPFRGLSFHFIDIAFHRAHVFNFNDVQVTDYIYGPCVWWSIQ